MFESVLVLVSCCVACSCGVMRFVLLCLLFGGCVGVIRVVLFCGCCVLCCCLCSDVCCAALCCVGLM